MSIKKGSTAIVDRYFGTLLVEKSYKGSNLTFDAFSNVSGTLPLSFTARAQQALKNYRLYGTENGAGVQTSGAEPAGYKIPLTITSGVTENLWDPDEITMGQSATIVYNYLQLEPNTQYTAWTTFPYNATSDVFIRYGQADSVTSSLNGFSDGHPRTASTNAEGWITIATRYNSNRPNPADYVYMLVKGSTAPDHYIPHRYTADYNLYIGSTELGAEEYVDYQEQQIYKMDGGVLTPTDPPSPLPAITAYEGENVLSSTETVGSVIVTGRISEIPEP